MSRFADLVRETRLRRGWTQEELAERTGVSRKTIIRWERDENVPESEQVTAVSSALGISTEETFEALGWLPDRQDQPDVVSRLQAVRDGVLTEDEAKIITDILDLAERGALKPEDRDLLQEIVEFIRQRRRESKDIDRQQRRRA